MPVETPSPGSLRSPPSPVARERVFTEPRMTRAAAIAAAEAYFDQGRFAADLARRVAIPTESQVEERAPVLRAYLADEIAPSLARLGFSSEIVDNPVQQNGGLGGPMLIA